eukprot:173708_1
MSSKASLLCPPPPPCPSLRQSYSYDTESEDSFACDDVRMNHLSAEDVIFHMHGYKKIKTICDTCQGQLFEAIQYDSQRSVAIKRTNKHLFEQRITIEDGNSLCISKHILKEALILRYLTVSHTPIGDYIIKYIDFFESNTDYYLVMEYVQSNINLKQFISKSREYIQQGLLSRSKYHKMMKYILWQLFVTIQWMHTMHCCHLDICTDNIMLVNATFIRTPHGVSINPKISIKLCDFGVSEVFQWNPTKSKNIFLCEKTGLSIDNEGYFAPKVFNNKIFDATCADNWSCGMILFECMTVGRRLYTAQSMYCPRSGYWSLFHHKLQEYLASHNLLQFFSQDSFSLMDALLNVDEEKRLKGIGMLKHHWFKMYFGRYRNQIMKKFYPQQQVLRRRYQKMNRNRFPFYK